VGAACGAPCTAGQQAQPAGQLLLLLLLLLLLAFMVRKLPFTIFF
jgi:MYXO-CTERM domain-containing protein